MEHTATYSPDDNKLRLYPAYRLDKDDYNRAKAAGFKWAPRQELFVAPMWTPAREDFLLEMCGEIGDEDTSLIDRAEERAERFEEYSDKRLADAESAHKAVESITSGIPLGQPILVGHHSERHARKDAERIENGMRRAVKMWETSEYWTRRAAGAVQHAKYKERADVRARRIKKIEADKRKQERTKAQAEKFLRAWSHEPMTLDLAMQISNYDWDSSCYPLAKYPRTEHTYEGAIGVRSAMEYGIITQEEAKEKRIKAHKRVIAWAERWIEHYNNRLAYEKAMLGEQGALNLIEKKPRPKQLPLLNYRAPDGLTVENPAYYAESKSHYPQTEMTKAQYKSIGSGSFIRPIENSHRVRCCSARHVPGALDGLTEIDRTNASYRTYCVFLTDSKTHEKPTPIERKPVERPSFGNTVAYVPPEKTKFDDLKETLRAGVKTVSAPQLFPTPPELAGRMVEEANISEGDRVLEPSAGTGNIVDAINNAGFNGNIHIEMVELNLSLVDILAHKYHKPIICGDFLEKVEFELGGKFDKIVMNPPFKNGEDIKHIKHAVTFLRKGGRLVALCANGPRQREQLKPLAENSGGFWEDLPAGTFKEAGTNVNTALLVIEN